MCSLFIKSAAVSIGGGVDVTLHFDCSDCASMFPVGKHLPIGLLQISDNKSLVAFGPINAVNGPNESAAAESKSASGESKLVEAETAEAKPATQEATPTTAEK